MGEAAFGTWLCRIAYNLSVCFLRKRKMTYSPIDERQAVGDDDIDRLLDDDTRIGQLGVSALLFFYGRILQEGLLKMVWQTSHSGLLPSLTFCAIFLTALNSFLHRKALRRTH